jgi:8-oxo-dGTP diphosphatase
MPAGARRQTLKPRTVHSGVVPAPLRAGVAVGAAIFHRDELLLVRRVPDFPGRWELPGGSVEDGEELEEALRREVREETGLGVVVGRPFHVSTFETDAADGGRVQVVAIEYLCAARARGPVRLHPPEHDAFLWAGREVATRQPLVPGFVRAIPEAFRLHELGVG